MTTQADITASLAKIGSQTQGTLVSLILRKKGVIRGSPRGPVVYDDDLVHVLLWSGFDYKALVERSLKKLEELTSSGTFCGDITKEAARLGYADATIEETVIALQEVMESLMKAVLPQSAEAALEEAKPNIFEPLYVNGQQVIGAKVYKGSGITKTEDGKAGRMIQPGTIYLDGVKLGEMILRPAENGHWESRHKTKTALKDLIRQKLPVGLYVRYNLDPDNVINTKVGKDARESAKRCGVNIHTDAVQDLIELFKSGQRER